ncbi:MAG: LLM class F420-dependent oxidoreductase, partial [Actinomycetes bacterium]
MKFGIAFANVVGYSDLSGLTALAQGAESAGFESLWTVEHVVFPETYESSYPYDPSGKMPMTPDLPMPDPLIWLSFAAAATTTIRLATGILILPQRNPVVLAKEVATLDELSGGRLELGVGVGWLAEEFAALGVPFAGRGARTDEYVDVLRTLWASDGASFDGLYVQFSGISVNPKPARGRVPVHVGGHTRAAAERAGRIGDGFFPVTGNVAELIDIARQTAASAGRDPEAIEITYGNADVTGADPLAAVQELESMGVDR